MRAACLVIFALLGCSAQSGSYSDKPTRLFVAEAANISFEVPQDWLEEPLGKATVLAGPKHTDAYFTTLTLQRRQGELGSLEDALRVAYTDNDNLDDVVFFSEHPIFVDDELALSYFVRFVLYEQPRLHAGVRLPSHLGIVDLTYTGPEPLFASQLGVWENVLATLALGAGSPDEL